MNNFRYVTRAEYAGARVDLENLIHKVQDEVRVYFTFEYKFIGSVVRNMVTIDDSSNIGYDFDVNIYVNDDEETYSPKEIRTILRTAFNKFSHQFQYDYPEDSTRVLTIKVKDRQNSKILHSADFAVVYDCSNGNQQYIHYNKSQNSYEWKLQPKGYYKLPDRINAIKGNNLWQKVRDLYLYKKNNNLANKKSRSLFAEAVNEIFHKYL